MQSKPISTETNEVEWCECGYLKNHKQRCGFVKIEHKEKIGRYSGFSKNYDGFQKVRK